MSINLRDARPTVVHIDTEVIRASKGLGEIFTRPKITLQARYAIPKHSNGVISNESNGFTNGDSDSRSSWLVGEQLDKLLSQEGSEGSFDVRWPFRSSKVADDWEGREFILSHIYQLLEIQIPSNTSPLLLVAPPSISLDSSALYTQLAFEKLNVPGLSILPTSLASLYALGSTTGLIIHIGHRKTTVSIISDSIPREECETTVDLGTKDCEDHFFGLLMQDQALDSELKSARGVVEWGMGQKEKLVKEVEDVVWRECTGDDIEVPSASGKAVAKAVGDAADADTFDVAKKLVGDPAPAPAAPSHKKKQPNQYTKLAAQNASNTSAPLPVAAPVPIDAIAITIPSIPGKEITLGPVRHRLCEPLFKGKAGGESVWECIGRAVQSPGFSISEAMAVWEGIGVVGELAKVKSLGAALMTYLSPFLLSSQDLPSDVQPAKARLLSIPDYFADFKSSTGELAPFLGGSMVAKHAFSDFAGKHCITKVDYNAKGPAAIYTTGVGEDR